MDVIGFNSAKHARHRAGSHESRGARSMCNLPLDTTGIVFSVGGVLYDDSIWNRWLLQQLTKLGLQTQYQAFFQVLENEYLPEVYCGQRDYWQALRAYLFSVGLSRGQVDEIEATTSGRRLRFEQEIRPMPGVRATLALLSTRGIPMAILCNAVDSAKELSGKLQSLGISQHFQQVVSSRDTGVAMPAPESYRSAVEALNIGPGKLLFVSNDQRELQGARAAGMISVAIQVDEEIAGDICLDRIDDLTGLVGVSQKRAKAG
ncbi:MAG: (S)-2-haloacid dehalogenase [Planctomycetota bacterium]